MIMFLIFCFIVLLVFCAIALELSKHSQILDSYADEYTIEEIQKHIDEDNDLIMKGDFKGAMLSRLLVSKTFWEDVLERKIKNKTEKYEDIVS